jgi:hypothetical protein
LPGWLADAQQARWLRGRIMELMRRIRWNMNGLARSRHSFLPAKYQLEFAFQNAEGLFKIMAMRRRAAAWRNVHLDKTEVARGVFAGEQDCIGVPNYPDMRQLWVGSGIRNRKLALQVVIWNALFLSHLTPCIVFEQHV